MGSKLKNIDRRNKFISLDAKDQKFLLRFVGDYSYEGKHFIKLDNGKYNVLDCYRINNDAPCEECEKYFEAIKPIYELRKKLKEATDDKEKKKIESDIKDVQNAARPYKVNIAFYYPVLKRAFDSTESSEATVFKTTLSVRLKLDEEVSNGMNVSDYDYIVRRTEQPGAAYYSLTRVDSKQTKDLSEDEKKMIDEAKDWDLEQLTQGKRGTSSLEVEEEKEVAEKEPAEAKADQDVTDTGEESDIPF